MTNFDFSVSLFPHLLDDTFYVISELRELLTGNSSKTASSSGASFFAWQRREASAKRVTGDELQGTMGRVQTAGEAPARSCVFFLAKKSFSWHGPIFGLFKS